MIKTWKQTPHPPMWAGCAFILPKKSTKYAEKFPFLQSKYTAQLVHIFYYSPVVHR